MSFESQKSSYNDQITQYWMKVLMHALATSCEELRARTGNPPLEFQWKSGACATNFPAVYLQGKMQGNKIDKEIARKSSFKQGNC